MKSVLCKVASIPATGAEVVDFFGRPALVYRHEGRPIATVAVCPHLGGPLELKEGELACAWHGARFDAATGRCTRWPEGEGSPPNHAMQLPTRIEDDALFYAWGE